MHSPDESGHICHCFNLREHCVGDLFNAYIIFKMGSNILDFEWWKCVQWESLFGSVYLPDTYYLPFADLFIYFQQVRVTAHYKMESIITWMFVMVIKPKTMDIWQEVAKTICNIQFKSGDPSQKWSHWSTTAVFDGGLEMRYTTWMFVIITRPLLCFLIFPFLLMVWYLLLIMHASDSHTLLEERSLCLSSNVVDSFNIVGELDWFEPTSSPPWLS